MESSIRIRLKCLPLRRSHSTTHPRSQAQVPLKVAFGQWKACLHRYALWLAWRSRRTNKGRPDSVDLVCRHCLSVSAPPKHYSKIHKPSATASAAGRIFFGKSAEILGLVAFFKKERIDCFLVSETSVIRPQGNACGFAVDSHL